MAQKVRRINLRFTPEVHDKLDEKRSRWRLSFQELGARLFHSWLTGESDVPSHASIRKPAEPLLEKLAMLQEHGDKDLLAFVKKVIDLLYSDMQQTMSPEELAHLKAVAYGEAEPYPIPQEDQPPRRGRPRKAT